jgi:uncharacterized membrane protein YfcA
LLTLNGHLGRDDAAAAAGGVIIGGKFASMLPRLALRRGFALLILLNAGFVIYQSPA